MSTLEVHDGQGRVRRVSVDRDQTVLFGSSPKCDVVLDDPDVLPFHGRIRWTRDDKTRVQPAPVFPRPAPDAREEATVVQPLPYESRTRRPDLERDDWVQDLEAAPPSEEAHAPAAACAVAPEAAPRAFRTRPLAGFPRGRRAPRSGADPHVAARREPVDR